MKAQEIEQNVRKDVIGWFLPQLGPKRRHFKLRHLRLDEHNCSRVFKNRNVNSRWLSKKYVNKLRSNPNWPIESFRAAMREDFVVGVSKDKLYRVKKKANVLIQGSYVE